MTIVILEKVPATVRGELSRWLIEPRKGIFVGQISAIVREKLWEMIAEKLKGGGAIMLHSMNNEQGYSIQTLGETDREVLDYEGLSLICVKESATPRLWGIASHTE